MQNSPGNSRVSWHPVRFSPGICSTFRDSIKIRSWILQKFPGIYGKFRDTCKIPQEILGFNGILSDFSHEFVVLSGTLGRYEKNRQAAHSWQRRALRATSHVI